MSFVSQAFTQAVDADLLCDVLEAVADLPANERDFEGSTFTIMRLLTERDLPMGKRALVATAISFRLQALARLTTDGGGQGWVLPGEPGCDFIHEELVRCAAEEPLIEHDGEPAFDSQSFHRRLLSLAEMRGEA